MVLFCILALILLILIAIVVTVVSLGGATFIVIFGDVIVCIFLIIALMRLILKKRK